MKDGDTVTCELGWQALRRDPMPWLLDDCGPGVRWRTLRDFVGRPSDSPAVVRARGGANAVEPVSSLLSRLQPDGAWACADGMWTRYHGVGWRLVAATQLGADIFDPRMRAAAERLLMITRDAGGLDPSPCVTARGLHMLAELGQARDPRFEEALAWLEAAAVKSAGPGWTCSFVGHMGPSGGCVITAVAVLGLLLAAPSHRRPGLRDRAVAELDQVLVGRSQPKQRVRLGWVNLLRTDLAEIFEGLARSGVAFRRAWMPSLRQLQAGQDSHGRWALGEPSPASLGITLEEEIGRPSPWVTLRAATAVMRYAVEAGLPRLFPQRPTDSSV